MPFQALHLTGPAAVLLVLVTALLAVYILVSLDDLLLDVAYLLNRRRIRSWEVRASDLERDRPAHIALMVGAWQEAGVVTPMVESTLRMMHYPASRVEFFVGVYPNDLATLPEVQELADRLPNVHCVVNEKPGPTSKSQNLNGVYAAIVEHERRTGKRFDVIAVHDAEDVIHPYTFRLYSTLLKRWKMVQLPVFALFPRMAKGGGGPRERFYRVLAQLVTGSYADEFAEHHLHHLPAREALGLFLPSAGTGFAMRRSVMELLNEDGQVLTEGALAEDYELALRLWRKGIRVHFHVQPLPRIDTRGQAQMDYVAVREYFPTEIAAAIKQKGRWTYGITLQTPQRLKGMRLNLRDRLTLWHDQKGKYTNLIHLIGYPFSLTLLVASAFGLSDQPTPLTRTLLFTVLGITAWRMLMRGEAVRRIYGLRQALIATLALPGLPLRWLIGNYINTLATVRAWRLYLFPEKGQKRGTARWDKTERKAYVPDEVLNSARRRVGDQLLFAGKLDARALSRLVADQRRTQLPLGQLALNHHLLDESQLHEVLATTQGVTYLDLTPEMIDRRLYTPELAHAQAFAVLGRRGDRLLIATPHATDPDRLQTLRNELKRADALFGLDPVFFATSPASLERAYRRPGLSGSVFRRILQDSRIPLDMIPHEFERARARGASSFGGKFRGTQVRDVNPVNTVFGTLVVPPLAGD
ncbi:glycosyl transferase family protein [Deinococcus aquiradiocola]|uniref:Bacteriophage N4 adsorption protein B n=1 Tax=Deinococcus aquiradiocola TaxID=393059 RepID=A0A917P804_9DEIO|nr:glycosyl transferase family protein [Deinococcus aquiradiocola]GGJ66130.1 bacteriophage N4 adsorption protein B [Deinococcus aquiradiocola]